MVVIGVLAAIALPTLLGERARGQDSAARADARNLASHMEACYASEQDYAACEVSEDVQGSGLPLGGGPGQVEVADAGQDSYEIVARSKSGNAFTITKAGAGPPAHTCGFGDEGGCPADGDW